MRLRDDDLAADLAARDFTINAMAEPLAGGEPLDPHGGRADLEARRLRMVSAAALADDPLRTLRAARLAVELGSRARAGHARGGAPAGARAGAAWPPSASSPSSSGSSAPSARRRGCCSPRTSASSPSCCPSWPRCAASSRTSSTISTSTATRSRCSTRWPPCERDAHPLGEHAAAVRALLAEPLGDDLTRGDAMRFAALLHDAAKPAHARLPARRPRHASWATTPRAPSWRAACCAACGPPARRGLRRRR